MGISQFHPPPLSFCTFVSSASYRKLLNMVPVSTRGNEKKMRNETSAAECTLPCPPGLIRQPFFKMIVPTFVVIVSGKNSEVSRVKEFITSAGEKAGAELLIPPNRLVSVFTQDNLLRHVVSLSSSPVITTFL